MQGPGGRPGSWGGTCRRADGYEFEMSEVPRSSNRRIGERVEVDPIAVSLVLDRSGRRGLRRRPAEISGRIVDVSVSGAAIECPTSAELANRTVASLSVHGSLSTVRVVRSTPGTSPGTRIYGVMFVHLDPRLQEELYAVLGRGRPTSDVWFTAR